MNFIIGLPMSKGKSVIMVVVDKLTKYAQFCTLSHPLKANTVAIAFLWKQFKIFMEIQR